MKSKNIPADIKAKSIKEAQNEIKEIIEKLESKFSYHNIFPKSHYKMAFKDTNNVALFNKAFIEYSNSENYQALLKKYQL